MARNRVDYYKIDTRSNKKYFALTAGRQKLCSNKHRIRSESQLKTQYPMMHVILFVSVEVTRFPWAYMPAGIGSLASVSLIDWNRAWTSSGL